MRVFVTPQDVGAEPLRNGRMMLLGLLSVGAAAGMMFLAMGVGDLYASVAVLGLLFVATVLVNPILGIVTLLGTILLGLPEFLAGSGRLTANNLLGLVLILALAIQICLKRDLSFFRIPQVILTLLIGGAFVASFIHAGYFYIPVWPVPKDFTENTLFLFFSRIAFLAMFVNFIRTRRDALVILVSLFLFTMAVIPSAFYNMVTWRGEVDVLTGKMEEFRIAADISSWGKNENRLAFMCNITILLIWMFAQIWKTRRAWALAMPVILALASLVVASGSRSGFLSLGLVFLFLLFQKGIPRSFRVGVVAAVAVSAMAFFLILPPKSSERLLNYSLDQSGRAEGWRSTLSRLETNEHALQVFAGSPIFGIGPGNFRWLHRELYPNSLAAGRPNHNSYLWAATEGGGLVLALYLLLFFFIWRDLRAAQQRFSRDDGLWHVTRFLKGYLMVFLFFSAFADFWLEPHLYLLAGLSILVRRLAAEEERPERESVEAVPQPALR